MSRGLLLHNPNCSKSRGALSLLREAGAAFDIREYISHPLSLTELRQLGSKLRQPPRMWSRSEEQWEDRLAASEESAYAALAEAPQLMQRPIFIRGPWALVCRPPDLVLSLLGDDLPTDTSTPPEWREVYRVDTHGVEERVVVVPSPQGAKRLVDHYEAKEQHQGFFVRELSMAEGREPIK